MEKIICAAVKVEETGKIYYRHRHRQCLDAANGELSWTRSRQEITKLTISQGFITSENRFVDRKEAWVIAEKNNQIIRVSGGEGTLALFHKSK